jgi:type II secretory ATPase GspE/PulE/Tfp pilus assembly ATPase PilB-like protein
VSTGLRRLVGDQGMRIPMEDMCAQDMLQLAQAQTLVPTLCPSCRLRAMPHLQRDQVSALELLEIDPMNLYVRYQGKGNQCSDCKGRGVRSRTILAEVVRPTADFLHAMLHEGVSAAMEVFRSSRTAGFAQEDQTGKNVMEHGLYKASIGMICTRSLLSMFDVTLHPMVIQRRAAQRARVRAADPDHETGVRP